MIVLMHFGDGSFKEISVDATEAEKAVEEAKTWVLDNAWFEVTEPETDEVLASESLTDL